MLVGFILLIMMHQRKQLLPLNADHDAENDIEDDGDGHKDDKRDVHGVDETLEKRKFYPRYLKLPGENQSNLVEFLRIALQSYY